MKSSHKLKLPKQNGRCSVSNTVTSLLNRYSITIIVIAKNELIFSLPNNKWISFLTIITTKHFLFWSLNGFNVCPKLKYVHCHCINCPTSQYSNETCHWGLFLFLSIVNIWNLIWVFINWNIENDRIYRKNRIWVY